MDVKGKNYSMKKANDLMRQYSTLLSGDYFVISVKHRLGADQVRDSLLSKAKDGEWEFPAEKVP